MHISDIQDATASVTGKVQVTLFGRRVVIGVMVSPDTENNQIERKIRLSKLSDHSCNENSVRAPIRSVSKAPEYWRCIMTICCGH
jgi:hypothetical protein